MTRLPRTSRPPLSENFTTTPGVIRKAACSPTRSMPVTTRARGCPSISSQDDQTYSPLLSIASARISSAFPGLLRINNKRCRFGLDWASRLNGYQALSWIVRLSSTGETPRNTSAPRGFWSPPAKRIWTYSRTASARAPSTETPTQSPGCAPPPWL